MKINRETLELICQLEYIIGKDVVNRNSYVGYKYPLTAYLRGTKGQKWTQDFSFEICPNDGLFNLGDPEEFVEEMRYVFGINKLYVGQAIVNMLSHIEQRYGLDFNELEAQRQSNQ